MAEENMNLQNEETEVVKVSGKADKKAKKAEANKVNFFVRVWKKITKLFWDTVGELKKVVWTPKAELIKNTKLVIATVVLVGVAIALVDFASSWIINSIAGLIG